jgi:hypothetical protein
MAFSDEDKLEVWQKGKVISGHDSTMWQQDDCGAWINYDEYGNRDSENGWEIDHITSKAHGGSEAPSNLRPLHWRNNVSKGAGRLECEVTAVGTGMLAQYKNKSCS